MEQAQVTLNAPAALAFETAQGMKLEVFGGFDAYSSDLLVSLLCKSKSDLMSPEEAALLSTEALEDDGIEFDGPDFASGLIRLSARASGTEAQRPAAMALAHVRVQANRGYHEDLGWMLKLHLEIGSAHIHRMGVGLGLHKLVAKEMANQVLTLVGEFKRTCKEDMTVLWSFEESLAACQELALRETLHRELLENLYAPLLHVTEDSVV
jgi:hypothetical protein